MKEKMKKFFAWLILLSFLSTGLIILGRGTYLIITKWSAQCIGVPWYEDVCVILTATVAIITGCIAIINLVIGICKAWTWAWGTISRKYRIPTRM